MTIEEAISYITHHAFIADDVKDMAIAALEKQIPKKPFRPFGTHSFKCTNCYKFVAHEVDDDCDLQEEMAEWCPYCGQALDWKVEEC